MKNKQAANGLICFLILCGLSYLSLTAAQPETRSFTGYLIVQENGNFRVDKEEFVRFQISGEEIKNLHIRLRAASGDLTFARWRKLVKDGSNFTDWFEFEGRELASAESTPVTYEYFLTGSYAGISPAVVPSYSMYETLKKVAESVGLPVPDRTFVIYGSSRSPIYEFFCYLDEPETTATGLIKN